MRNYLKATLIFFLSCESGNAFAQLTAWLYKDPVQIQNPGSAKTNYQVLITVNTQTLIAAGKMNSAGNDIRFAKNCSGSILFDYWIESGINSAATQIWVKIDALQANGNLVMYMYYGNSAAAATSNFNVTFPSQKIVTGQEIVSDSIWNYDWVEIQSGAKVVLSPTHPGKLVINARRILVNDSLNAVGSGYAGGTSGNGSGPGGGGQNTAATGGGGGGGYGGAGGQGGYSTPQNNGGITYGTSNTPASIEKGSGGGKGGATNGGKGGGCFELNATSVSVGGKISAGGADGVAGWYTGGGGSGGGIMIKAYRVVITGNLSAPGGKGGSSPSNNFGGGGGGGGRIKIFYDNFYSNTGTNNVAGGIHQAANNFAQNGAAGTFYSGTFVSGIPTYTILPGSTANAGVDVTICTGGSATLNSSGGTAYSWSPASGLSATNISNPVASPASTTTYSVTVTDVNGCTGTDAVTVSVNPPITASAGNDVTICVNDSTLLTGSGGINYVWSSGQTTASITVSPAATTTYTLFVSDAIGCSGTDEVTVSVDSCAVGIFLSSPSNQNILIIPNPTTGKFYLSLSTSLYGEVQICNMLGEKVFTSPLAPLSHGRGAGGEVDLSSHPAGIYFVKIIFENESAIHKLVKQ